MKIARATIARMTRMVHSIASSCLVGITSYPHPASRNTASHTDEEAGVRMRMTTTPHEPDSDPEIVPSGDPTLAPIETDPDQEPSSQPDTED
jgi:hypothetical protein